jgi:hypothetical protein
VRVKENTLIVNINWDSSVVAGSIIPMYAETGEKDEDWYLLLPSNPHSLRGYPDYYTRKP